ncbi:CidA/LrgA family protein [Desulfuromonas thiophila]|uniref:Holin-like protein n=1 Tax=Desulfuromonas thiophila TaxID=57664 RepID=A0A1G6XIE0_9BACT|nr:CidA/LrgA family protein [Desulfuromonas thiophila]SDD77969.1 holin-like protein [Desulfuromonas thiophila]
MLRSWTILLGLQALGELGVRLCHLPLPGSVLGMVLLLAALRCGLVREEAVRPAAELLLTHLSLLFVPAGVGVLLYFDLIRLHFWPLVLATLGSTLVVLALTGWTYRLLARPGEGS